MRKDPRIAGIGVRIALVLLIVCGTVYRTEATGKSPEPSRLFTIPKGEVLNAFAVNLCAGRGFGVEGGGSFWGASAGLGGVGEIEISTTKTVNRLTEEANIFPISAFKVQLCSEKSRRPSLSIALRVSDWNEWSAMRSMFSESALDFTVGGKSLESVDFNSRFTILYGVASKSVGLWRLHGGLTLTDVRTRDGYASTTDAQWKSLKDLKKNLVSAFAGIEYQKNAHTKIVADVQSVPEYNLDQDTEELAVSRLWLGVAGIRFFLTSWLAIDGGVSYQSNYSGIGDAEITLGTNVTFDVAQKLSKMANDRKR
ncbi:MAG: hypothetical protein V1800_11220 [Candidatus Latescibacterota bacterium]